MQKLNGKQEGGELSHKIMQTHLYMQGGTFFISTIYRRSSAALNPDGWYYETMCWKLQEDGDKGELVDDNSGAMSFKSALDQHVEVITRLKSK